MDARDDDANISKIFVVVFILLNMAVVEFFFCCRCRAHHQCVGPLVGPAPTVSLIFTLSYISCWCSLFAISRLRFPYGLHFGLIFDDAGH
jgi:hypothetical protein